MRARGMGSVFRPWYTEKQPDGTRISKQAQTWSIQWFINGKPHRESSGSTNKRDAEKLLKLRNAQAQSGKPVTRDVERTTLGDLVEMVRNNYKANGYKMIAMDAPLNHLLAYFGADCRATDITSDRVTAYIAARQASGAANGTVNRSLAALKRAFSLAEDADRVVRRPRIKLLRERNARRGFFEADQFEAVKAELPAELKAAIECAYITGWRIKSEIFSRPEAPSGPEVGMAPAGPGRDKKRGSQKFSVDASIARSVGSAD